MSAETRDELIRLIGRGQAVPGFPPPDDMRIEAFPASDHRTADLILEWQASREVTEAEVEEGCRAFYNDAYSNLTEWERLVAADPKLADRYRDGIRAALVAAREVRS